MAMCKAADLSDACARGFWAAVIPTAFIAVILVTSVPPVSTLLRLAKRLAALRSRGTHIAGEKENSLEEEIAPGVPLWRTLVLSSVSLIETLLWLVYTVNLLPVAGLLVLVFNVPLAIPSKRIKKEDIGKKISLEDYITVWGWASFRWVVPLLEKGTYTTLNESDVRALSPSTQAKPLHVKFLRTTGKLIVFNYASPFFLKRILDALSGPPDAEKRALAYLYAFLAFVSALCKAQADVQHLWYGRGVCTRIRTELMTAIYDKALKRKDFAGIVDKDKVAEQKGMGDRGKIVNLMAGDGNRIAMTVSAMSFIYGAPFEIFIATLFLYQLLGWSAIAGFLVLLLTWPLNNFMARRAVRIQKGVSTARDKRMGVLNELISAVKFIKFFAWEDQWTKRVMEAREGEMQWSGDELTIGTAFTAIALFQMVRVPLNVIPAWIVQILQLKVALDRITTYLDEDEVDAQVSTIKLNKGHVPASEDTETGLGIIGGSFKWNEVEERKGDKCKGKNTAKSKTNGTDAHASSSDAEEAPTRKRLRRPSTTRRSRPR
ncbi:ABC transporter type 1, transmembrane domain-containing protein [Dichomitus squalens]|nr:ABC transporter type 1, transmembrane domain-containing protein [Dichomitus squalens]